MQEIVAALGFRKVGQITLKESTTHPRFVLDGEFNGRGAQDHAHGWVYLWIAIDRQSSFNVRYVGKAGKSLKARCTQHEGGFKGGSTKGVRHADEASTPWCRFVEFTVKRANSRLYLPVLIDRRLEDGPYGMD